MAAGPFIRIIAQVAIVAGGAVFRAFLHAYKESAMRNAQGRSMTGELWRRMSIEEAQKILGLERWSSSESRPNCIGDRRNFSSRNISKDTVGNTDNEWSLEVILQKKKQLFELNNPTEKFPGSPYLQQKVLNAFEVLEQHVKNSSSVNRTVHH